MSTWVLYFTHHTTNGSKIFIEINAHIHYGANLPYSCSSQGIGCTLIGISSWIYADSGAVLGVIGALRFPTKQFLIAVNTIAICVGSTVAHLGHIAIRGPLTRNRCNLYVVSGILIPFHSVSDQSVSGRQPILHLFCDL